MDFLHSVGIAHTGLKLSNFLLGVDDPALFFSFEDAEHTQPAPRKILEDRTIYVSRRMYATDGLPFLCDLGQARFPEEIGNRGAYIMPDVYRAPEITMHMKWDCMASGYGATTFQGKNADGTFHDDRFHTAKMIALMAPPPPEFLERSRMCSALWEEDGTWKHSSPVPIPDITLEKLAAEKIMGEDVDGFLLFFKRMLRWLPEQRPDYYELLFDPWLMKGLEEH